MWILCAHTGQWREAEKRERERRKKIRDSVYSSALQCVDCEWLNSEND